MNKKSVLERLKPKKQPKKAVQADISEVLWSQADAILKQRGTTWVEFLTVVSQDLVDEHKGRKSG